ncbi:MAG: phage holin family protein [Apilactobacillus sp.]|uniref:phage holin family protein n=1 Tax=Apilactobacillus TaxID=2767877 RepID=UPI0025F41859|nr:phage holin family protein [Apilactobacillus sp.]MCT6822545.1 phage holin family protein [Apilactobacillus sp.]MCT6858033.1 phage holin family protein [Apilactobacillus sp.]
MRILGRILINTLLFMAIAGFFQGSFYVASITTALIAAVVLAVLNALVKPVLFILSLPINIITLGLFSIVLNGIMLEITSAVVGSNFHFASFGMAIIAALIMSICNIILSDY